MTQKQYSTPWEDYELLDVGAGRKLERFGEVILIRPELQADFQPVMSFEQWRALAHWEFVESSKHQGRWQGLRVTSNAPRQWPVGFEGLQFNLRLTKFKHVGVFPEQAANWKFIQQNLRCGQHFLNLFAYTGAASLVARQQGAEVHHVDAVKQLVTWANENMASSHLGGIHWVLEDALKFAQREVKRGHHYDGIVMDPPAFGLGANGEKWILQERLPTLLEAASRLLGNTGFLLVNTYSPKLTLPALESMAARYFAPTDRTCLELRMKSKTGNDLFYGNILHIKKV